MRFIWRQGLSQFLDLNPTGVPVCGPLGPGRSGATSPLTGNITVPAVFCETQCLTEDQWNQLFFTLFHESMHSTDSIVRRFLDAAAERAGGLRRTTKPSSTELSSSECGGPLLRTRSGEDLARHPSTRRRSTRSIGVEPLPACARTASRWARASCVASRLRAWS